MKPGSPSPQQTFEALSEAGAAFKEASQLLEEAQQLRDAAIIASSEQGFSRRKVATAAGITVGRVQQVLTEVDIPARRKLADRVLEIAVKRLPKKDQDRYAEEWHALIAEFDAPMAKLSVALSLLRGSASLKRTLKTFDTATPAKKGK